MKKSRQIATAIAEHQASMASLVEDCLTRGNQPETPRFLAYWTERHEIVLVERVKEIVNEQTRP
jgi:hypothetical protein